MGRISQEDIDAIRAKADIVDVIGHYLQVQKKGRNYKAVCPFHQDHDPSLNINPERQIFKCFVCGKGGNVFTFVQNYEKISFPEAVVKVADIIGVPVSIEAAEPPKPKDPHLESLYAVLSDSIRYTMYELNSTAGVTAKEYLEKRGQNRECIEQFQIGYNPTGDLLCRFMQKKGYSDKDLVSTNVARITSDGLGDVFSGRITYPIHDIYGNPVGFSARALNPDNPSKYINTTETEIYVKGKLVYNYHRAKDAARRAGEVIICEGVTDVIAFWKAGIENCVCTLGTACTNEQISLIARMAPKIVFCYDGDAAGQNAIWKGIQLAKKTNREIAVVVNQTGMDPDEIVRKSGVEALKEMSLQKVTWMEWYLNYEAKRTNMNSYMEKKEFVKKVEVQISELTDQTDRQYFSDRLTELTGIRVEQNDIRPLPRQESERRFVPVKDIVNGSDQAEELILVMMMKSPEAIRIYEDNLAYLSDSVRNGLAYLIQDTARDMEKTHSKNKIDPSSLIDRTDDSNIQNLIAKLISSDTFDMEYDSEVLKGAIRRVKRAALKARMELLSRRLVEAIDDKEREDIGKSYGECLMKLRRYLDDEDRKEE